MSAAGGFTGWLAAALALALCWRTRRELARRGEAVIRACHELRGPLTAVGLGLELGARTGRLSRAQWQAIQGELDRTGVALADLQGAPTGETAPAAVGAVDLRQLLGDAVEVWRPRATAAGVKLELHWAGGHPCLRGDRIRLAQATGNLIANAIEHGGGRVEVRGRGWGEGARIEVIDDGPGLPATVTQLRRGARRRGNRGRGLAIAAGVAEAHGGRLAEAQPGHPLAAGRRAQAPGTWLVLELCDGAGRLTGRS